MKKCMEYEVEGSRLRGRPKRTWREAHELNREDVINHNRWRKLIKDG